MTESMQVGCWLGEWEHVALTELSIPRRPNSGSGLSRGVLVRQLPARSGLHPALHLFLCRKQREGLFTGRETAVFL